MERQNKLKDSLLSFLTNLFDLVILNWLWLLCSLPVVTIGPATCGLYTATMKLARKEAVSPAKDFFRGLRENLKNGFLLGALAAVILAAIAGDVLFALANPGWIRTMYLVVAVIIGVIWLILIGYAFSLQVMFDAPLKVHIENAFKLAVIAPGKTIAIWLLLLIPVIAALVLPPVAVGMLGFLYIFVGFSAPVYFANHLQMAVFSRVHGSVPADVLPNEE